MLDLLYEKACRLCPRDCGVLREAGAAGYCGADAIMRVAYADLHLWEEPPISCGRGSGAVFFSGCSLRCAFCQNHEISRGSGGQPMTPKELSRVFLALQDKGAANINLVTGAHFAPQVARSVRAARADGLRIPVIWNSGGYEKVETLRALEDTIDAYLPDFKFWSEKIAGELAGAPDYRRRAKAAIAEMVRQKGPCQFGVGGRILSGVIVRHLILPGHLSDTRKILSFLYAAFGDDIYVSLLRQYTPLAEFPGHEELERRVTDDEYEKAADFAAALGMKNLFLQEEGCADEAFIPDFKESRALTQEFNPRGPRKD